MTLNDGINIVIAAGCVVGGIDRILGNRRGYGKEFEEGFMLLGPTALNMAGIICLADIFAAFLQRWVVTLLRKTPLDPSCISGILALDMGGYALSQQLASDISAGLFSGIVVAASLGCTLSFTIPVGGSIIPEEKRESFYLGLAIGLFMIPVTFLIGGVFCGLTIVQILIQSSPALVISALCAVGFLRFPEKLVLVFRGFAVVLKTVITAGLIIGAVCSLTGMNVPGLVSLDEAMKTVSTIGITLLGSLPVVLFIRRALGRPLEKLGKKTGMNDASMAGFLATSVSSLPTFSLMRDMDRKGVTVNAAFLVSSSAFVGAHFAFTSAVQPDLAPAIIITKFAGGLAAAAAALFLTRNMKEQPNTQGVE